MGEENTEDREKNLEEKRECYLSVKSFLEGVYRDTDFTEFLTEFWKYLDRDERSGSD